MAANQQITISLTGKDSGLSSTLRSGQQQLLQFNSAVQKIAVSAASNSAATIKLRAATGQYSNVVKEARAVAAQLSAEKAKMAEIDALLTQNLSKQELQLLRSNGLMQNMNHAAGSASFAVLSLGQGLQDAGQFGMGAAQGIRAVTNNIQQSVQAIVLMTTAAGGLTQGLKAMWAAMMGPIGLLLAFSTISAAVEFFANRSQMAKKEADDLTVSLDDLVDVIGGPDKAIVTVSQLNERIEGLRDRISDLKEEAPTLTERFAALWVTGKILSDGTKTLREELEKLLQIMPKGGVFSQTGDERRLAVQQAAIDDLTESIIEYQDKLDTLEEPMVGELQQRLDLLRDSFRAGIPDAEQFAGMFAEFQSTISRINPDLEVTRSQFARMVADGGVDKFLAEEQWKKTAEYLKSIRIDVEKMGLSGGIFGSVDDAQAPDRLYMSAGMQAFIDDHQAYIDAQNRVIDANSRFRDSMAQFGTDLIVSFATIGGGMDGLQRTFGRFMTKYGAELVKMGLATILLGKSLAGVRAALKSLNPVAAIAAGAALVAAGSRLRAQGRSSAASLSGSGSGGVGSAPAYFTSGAGSSVFTGGNGVSSSLFPQPGLGTGGGNPITLPGLLSGGYGGNRSMRIQLVASGRDLVGAVDSELIASGRSSAGSPFVSVGAGVITGGSRGDFDGLI